MNAFLILLFIFVNFLGLSIAHPVFAVLETGTVNVAGTVTGCGDEIIQSGEECDGSNLVEQTCSSRGFYSGSLICTASCTFDTSACTSAPPPPPPGGGGRGRNIYLVPQVVVDVIRISYQETIAKLIEQAKAISRIISEMKDRADSIYNIKPKDDTDPIRKTTPSDEASKIQDKQETKKEIIKDDGIIEKIPADIDSIKPNQFLDIIIKNKIIISVLILILILILLFFGSLIY